MEHDDNKSHEKGRMPAAPTGNASNPSAEDEVTDNVGDQQLLDSRAEKYLREVASIEDLPDEQDWQDAEDNLSDDKR
jgi:hypothetical protein